MDTTNKPVDKPVSDPVPVVAALLRDSGGRIFITRRQPSSSMPMLWEFPGGKVEAGEEPKSALRRELQEEVGIEVDVGNEVDSCVVDFLGRAICLSLYECVLVHGKPKKLGISDFCWVTMDNLRQYDFPPADQILIERLCKR